MTVVYNSDDLLIAVDHVEPIFQSVLWLVVALVTVVVSVYTDTRGPIEV